jgi:CheY-like chemotaxis protein
MADKQALIIEDNHINAQVLQILLSAENVASTLISNPAQIHNIVPGLGAVDVVFLDLEMPGINGYEVLRMLRDDLGITAPVVACTVHTSQIDIARIEGFDSFIGKPLIAEKFSDQLSQILKGEPVWELP